MKLWDIVRNVGTGIIRNVVPGGGMIIDVVNELLPDDKKLGQNATGADIDLAIASMPPDIRARILEKEFDVDITRIQESNATLRVMLESDTKNPQTTRPYIAKQAFHVIAFAIIVTVSMWAYAVLTDNQVMVETVSSGWPFILSVIGPFVTLLWAYFGILRQEHKARLAAADNKPAAPAGITGLISALVNRK